MTVSSSALSSVWFIGRATMDAAIGDPDDVWRSNRRGKCMVTDTRAFAFERLLPAASSATTGNITWF